MGIHWKQHFSRQLQASSSSNRGHPLHQNALNRACTVCPKQMSYLFYFNTLLNSKSKYKSHYTVLKHRHILQRWQCCISTLKLPIHIQQLLAVGHFTAMHMCLQWGDGNQRQTPWQSLIPLQHKFTTLESPPPTPYTLDSYPYHSMQQPIKSGHSEFQGVNKYSYYSGINFYLLCTCLNVKSWSCEMVLNSCKC